MAGEYLYLYQFIFPKFITIISKCSETHANENKTSEVVGGSCEQCWFRRKELQWFFLGSRRAWIHFSFLPSMIGGVTRKQPSLNDQGCAERFKVICSLIQIQSAKTWAFHIPTILPLCAISPDPYPHLFFYFFYGLRFVMASGQQRDLDLH